MVAQRVEIDYDVIPGITAIQALTARHRIPLNDIGEPVLITTGRRLAADGLAGSAVVMLDGDCAFRSCPPETRIWWGAYLGTPDELLVSGTVGEVGEQIAKLRAEARAAPRLDHGHLSAASPVAATRPLCIPYLLRPLPAIRRNKRNNNLAAGAPPWPPGS